MAAPNFSNQMISWDCPECGERHTAWEGASGLPVLCGVCGHKHAVPDLPEDHPYRRMLAATPQSCPTPKGPSLEEALGSEAAKGFRAAFNIDEER